MVTECCGPYLGERPASSLGDPIKNKPGGITTISGLH